MCEINCSGDCPECDPKTFTKKEIKEEKEWIRYGAEDG